MTAQLQQAISLIKAGKKQEGGRLLNQVLKADPADEEAWLWTARIVSTDEKRIYCLEQGVTLNPQNQITRQVLDKLEARAAVVTGWQVNQDRIVMLGQGRHGGDAGRSAEVKTAPEQGIFAG